MAPAYAWFLALRYLLSRWVNVLGMAGVAVAIWALLVVISVFSGFIAEIREHIRGATADLVLTGVKTDCSYAAVRPILEADPDVVATAPRLSHYGIVYPQGLSRRSRRPVIHTSATGGSPLRFNFVSLIGVDPAREAQATGFTNWLELAGDPPGKRSFGVADPEQPFAVSEALFRRAQARAGILLGDAPVLSTAPGVMLSFRRMTRGQLIEPGQMLDLVTARFVPMAGGADRVPTIRRRCVVTGAFETKHRTFDEYNAIVDIELLREMLGHPEWRPDSIDLVTEVAVKVRADADLSAVQQRLQAAVTPHSGGVVMNWEEQNQVFLDAVDHERAMMKVVLFCVMLVAAFLIYATLNMMVTQKVKDIGILASLGAVPGGISTIFVLCGGVIGAGGCGLGLAAGLLSSHYLNDVNDWLRRSFGLELFPTDLYDLDRIPYRIELPWVLQVLAGAFVLVLLVAWVPARRAARLDPVKALAHE
ncbi:MAG: FtsX-like permease family protein [Planctomycetota bacterium]